MSDVHFLFDNDKHHLCEICHRPLPSNYEDTLCPACKEQQLFSEVKDYIRANDVTEYDVATHFVIPLSLVKRWIKEGRIEYKTTEAPAITGMHCQRCGAKVTFGSLCQKCLRFLNNDAKGYSMENPFESDTRMHYLDANNSKD